MTPDPVPKRGPGRPAGGDSEQTRQKLVDAARTHFAASGFAGASLRAIAQDAGVDASLIRHHFGDKSRLLVATMELPVNPAALITEAVGQGHAGLGERLVRAFLTAWDPHREVISAMIRSAVGTGDPQQAPAIQLVRRVLVGSLTTVLEGDERELRAELIAAQIIGLAMLRYVIQLHPLASAGIAEVVAIYGPAIQAIVTPEHPAER